MAMLLQRICWNEYKWTRPSGLPKDEGYPKKEQFGWDEWNFNLLDAYDGHVYGYTPYSPSDKAKATLPSSFCVAFWSKEPPTQKIYIVGSMNKPNGHRKARAKTLIIGCKGADPRDGNADEENCWM